MNIDAIAVGANPPQEINVIIEVAQGSAPVKYEMDKASGALFVDRILHTAMFYPANYGFIPKTLSDDGDPADVLVVTPLPVMPGAVISARPVGVLVMEDEKGMDEKILAVPTDDIYPIYAGIKDYTDLPEVLIQQIGHFFERYKDLEKNKWVKVKEWQGANSAQEIIAKAIANYR